MDWIQKYMVKRPHIYVFSPYRVIYWPNEIPCSCIFYTVMFSENRNSKRDINTIEKWKNRIWSHCIRSVRIRSYSGPDFPAFRLNTEYNIQYEYGKIRTRITPNTDTFYAVSGHYIPVFEMNTCSKLAIHTQCEICSRLTIKTPEQRHWRIEHLFLVFLIADIRQLINCWDIAI